MKINLTGINPHSESGSKMIRRPHSYDREMSKHEEYYPIQTQRKKKAVSLQKKEHNRRRSNTTSNSNSTTLKLDGLQMLPKKNMGLDDDDFEFQGRLTNVEATKIGGNIFINNNINLFISKEKDSKELSGKPEIGRRQNYVSKRRAHNSVFIGLKNPEFPS